MPRIERWEAAMPEATDEELVARCLRGDASAFESLFDRYERKLFFFALQMVRNREDALDISQASFAQAFLNLRTFDFQRPFAPWLLRIARNQCIDRLRKRDPAGLKPLAEGTGTTALADDPAVLAEKRETSEQIWTAMNRLTLDQREVLVLREFHDMSYKEIAAVLDIPIGTVMSRLSAARKRMRTLLEGYL